MGRLEQERKINSFVLWCDYKFDEYIDKYADKLTKLTKKIKRRKNAKRAIRIN